MVSLLNGLSEMGKTTAAFAGTAALDIQKSDLQRQSLMLADQLATNREVNVTQPFQASQEQARLQNLRDLQGGQQAFTSKENAATREAAIALKNLELEHQMKLKTFESTLPTPEERLLRGLGLFTAPNGLPTTTPQPSSGASGATPTPAKGATGGSSGVDAGTWDTGDGSAQPSPGSAAVAPPATDIAAAKPAMSPIIAGILNKKFGVPEPGSEAETRMLMANDLAADPVWGKKSDGERGLEIVARISAMKALERGGIYKFEPATAPDPDDPTGKATVPGFMRFNVKTGDSQFIPTNTNPNKGGTGGMGSRSELYFDRMMKATNMAVAAASNIMELPESSSTGWFGNRHPGTTLLGAAKESLVNSLTTQEVQDYNVMITGLARNLANIETSGLAPPGSFSKSLGEGITLKEGDSYITKLRRMAEVRQIVTEGMRDVFANPKVPKEQKDALQGTLDTLKEAIPFTQHDITVLQKAPKGTTLADVAGQKGLGGKQPSAGGGGSQSGTFDDTGGSQMPAAPTILRYDANGNRVQ